LSTMQKVLIGIAAAAVLSGGVAWAAVEASSSQRGSGSRQAIAGPRLPFGPGVGSGFGRLRGQGAFRVPQGVAGSQGLLGPGGRRGFLGPLLFCRVAHVEAVLVGPGSTHDVRLDHGTVDAVSSNSVTIKEADGTTVMVPIDRTTVVRRDSQQASTADLKIGDVVLAVREGTGAAKVLRDFGAGARTCGPGGAGPLILPSPSSA
jgi:hypothetical protein